MIVKLTLLTIIESTNYQTAYFFQRETKTILPIELNKLPNNTNASKLLETTLYVEKELLDLAGITVTKDLIEKSLAYYENTKDT